MSYRVEYKCGHRKVFSDERDGVVIVLLSCPECGCGKGYTAPEPVDNEPQGSRD